ncbi:dipeptidase [Bacillus sp. CGMCC 1.16607]|uniref:dipeptidase n=1 Tax=Bacillus sp. CGMCC 1.16607 TaxID=3351842 RepID=UPI003627E7D6
MSSEFFYPNDHQPFILDAHFDLLMDVQIQREKGRTKVIETDYLPRFKAGGIHVIVAAVFVDGHFVNHTALQTALGQISGLFEEVSESSDKLMICLNANDMRKAYESGKIGFLLSLEGAEPLGTDLSLLRIFYELGVRNLGLVWSRRNQVGEGSHFQPIREGRKGGITSFGIKVIEEAEKLGITVDVSHLNDEGFLDVLEFSKRPIIASHSNARSLCPTMRNLTDIQMKAIASKNGVIGINAVSMLVADSDKECKIEKLANHVDYMKDMVGIEHIGIGLDLCDDFMKYVSPEDLLKMPRNPFDIIQGHQNFPKFIEELLKRGYKENELSLLLGLNFLRVFETNMNNLCTKL